MLPVAVLGVLAVDLVVPVVLGPAYVDAAAAFPPALAAVVLAPLNALTLQAAALRLRPEATLAAAAAGAVAFVGGGGTRPCPRGERPARRPPCSPERPSRPRSGCWRCPAAPGGGCPSASLAGAVAVAGWGVFL